MMLSNTIHYLLILILFTVNAFPLGQDGHPAIDVTLRQIDNTLIKATVTNNGKEDIKFLHLNFFPDKGPVKKVDIYQDGAILL